MSDGTFLAYTALLAISGVMLLVLAAGGFGQSAGARVLDALFGAGFLAYGIYLFFFFEGGTVQIFFYAFVVPVLAVVHAVKARKAQRRQQAHFYVPSTQYGAAQPYPYAGIQPGAPGFGQPYPQPGQPFGYPASGPGYPGAAPQQASSGQ